MKKSKERLAVDEIVSADPRVVQHLVKAWMKAARALIGPVGKRRASTEQERLVQAAMMINQSIAAIIYLESLRRTVPTEELWKAIEAKASELFPQEEPPVKT